MTDSADVTYRDQDGGAEGVARRGQRQFNIPAFAKADQPVTMVICAEAAAAGSCRVPGIPDPSRWGAPQSCALQGN